MGARVRVREANVRDATVEDAEGIHDLACELAGIIGDAPPSLDLLRTQLAELLDEPRARVLVVENDDALVGAASLWIKPDLAHGDVVVEVPMLVVAEDFRRGGIGRLLMDEVRNVAASYGATVIELVATRSNVAARDFYRSLGFVEADVIPLEFVGDLQYPPDEG